MDISNNWLKQYVDHDLDAEALAEALTMAGLEVEGIDVIGAALDGVVVGHVTAVREHPNADRLTLCDVDLGADETVQIACGAPNVAAGQKVPVATLGTTLMLPSRDNPDEKTPVTIEKAKLRGETSHGMICAEDELGLSDDHSGIMVLREDAEAGQPFADYLRSLGTDPQDAVLDIAITPNRPDATSHLGVARDVAALYDLPLHRPEVNLPDAGGEAAEHVTVDIQAPEACPRYVALLVRDVEITESPAWLKQRLTAIGLRPRNVIVDITNFVMHECGQPLHAFDFDQIAGHTIVVDTAEGGETFTTLDDKEHTLPEGTLLIGDAERPVALAGIMGGQNSEVTDATTDVLIESAYFDPSTIRRAAKLLGISSDSSYRFERGVDRVGQVWAAARAAQLMVDLAGGTLVPGMVDAHPLPLEPVVLTLRPERVDALLGVNVPTDRIGHILTKLGFEVDEEGHDGEAFRVTVPTWRPDVEREVDLIEEVARIYGYNQIPEPAHTRLPNRTPRELPVAQLRRSTRALLSGLGYRETYTNSMLPLDTAEAFNVPALGGEATHGPVVETLNPISQEMKALRPSLLPGLLEVVQFNQNHGQEVLRFYEFGHVFRQSENGGVVPGYAEHEAFIAVASGPVVETTWDQQGRPLDVFDLKGVVEQLLTALRIPDVTMTPSYDPAPVMAYHLQIASGSTPVGVIARLADAVMDEYDLREPVFFAELDWSTLVGLAAPYLERRYAPVSRFPVVDRDIAVVVPRRQPIGPMLDLIREAGCPLLRHVGVFDLYEGEHIDADKKSVAFSLRFGADRTLTDQEVDERVAAILNRLRQETGASLRQ
jgi:phenylalanyl-tRNA synthetase beta chain